MANGRFKLFGNVAPQSPRPEIAAHHALARAHLENVEDVLPLAKTIEEDGHGGYVQSVGAQPDEMTGNPRQLGQDHPHGLGAWRRFNI